MSDQFVIPAVCVLAMDEVLRTINEQGGYLVLGKSTVGNLPLWEARTAKHAARGLNPWEAVEDLAEKLRGEQG